MQTPLLMKTAYGIEVAVITGIWFAVLTIFLNVKAFKSMLSRSMHRIEQVMGAVLVALAGAVVLERR